MLRASSKSLLAPGVRHFSSAPKGFNVTVVGAAGGIGQPLSLLCKLDDQVKDLRLYDVAPVTPGVAADISHIGPSKTTGYTGDQLGEALTGADVVIVPAGVPRKPGMTRDDLFNTNASIVFDIASRVAECCPTACVCIISNPVNSTVPIAAEVLRAKGVYDPRKLFGVTTLDVVRANTFVSQHLGRDVSVPVIGGHAGTTILPLLSNTDGEFEEADRDALTHRIMFGGDEVVKAKDGAGSATLSMALAGWKFANVLMSALDGKVGQQMCTFVENDKFPTEFFSSNVTLGPEGVAEIHGAELNEFEQAKYDEMLPDLEKQIQKGKEFAAKKLQGQ